LFIFVFIIENARSKKHNNRYNVAISGRYANSVNYTESKEGMWQFVLLYTGDVSDDAVACLRILDVSTIA